MWLHYHRLLINRRTDGIPVSAVLHDNIDLEGVFHELVDSTSLNDNHKQLLFTLLMDYSLFQRIS